MNLVEQLNHIFYPKAVAVIGASNNPNKLGFMSVANLLEAGFGGRIYPINPRRLFKLLGLTVYPSLGAIPGEVDLAVIAVPAELTVSAVEECVTKGVKGAVMFASGFRELGTEIGLELQNRIRDIANKGGLKIIGPNCLGLVNLKASLNATFQPNFSLSKVGGVSIAAQSGGVCVYIADTLTINNVGISKAISLGNRCNLSFDEVLAYFAEDEDTKMVIIHIEGLEKPRQLMSIARQMVKRKPIIAYKGARGEESNRASLSHTGSLAGNYEFYKAAFTQAGMITVDNITELVDIAKALTLQPPSSGDRVALLSAQAGPGMIMADKSRELGLKLADFSPVTKQRLRRLPLNTIETPVDLAWIASDSDAYREVLTAILEDEGVDLVAVAALYFPVTMGLMRAVVDLSKYHKKPAIVCIDTPTEAACEEVKALEESGIPAYPLPERAVTGLAGLVRYGKILRSLS